MESGLIDLLRVGGAVVSLLGLARANAGSLAAPTYRERYRPQFHFSPATNWMNDPNGLVYYDGEYHLFYQYNPFGLQWGHLSWGHAVSPDLVHWHHLPVAIPEADGVMAFSGSAVVDRENTSGFGRDGKPPLVAIYTGHHPAPDPAAERQAQHLAYSTDRGRTWVPYEGNPILDIGTAHFRDPKVFWYAPEKKWVMVVALSLERKVHFYASPDLKRWTFLSAFGPAGAVGGFWECPDLFELPVDGDPNDTRWVLQVDVGDGGVAQGSGAQYFVGHFDGTTFTVETGDPAGPLPPGFEDRLPPEWAAGEGGLASRNVVFGFLDRHVAGTVSGREGMTGTLVSPPFELTHAYLNFLLAGGHRHDETRVELLVDDRVVRTARGTGSETPDWVCWDVRDLRGRTARLRLVDRPAGPGGRILIDHVERSDTPVTAWPGPVRWVDYGADFYAAITWAGLPEHDGRRIWVGWMNNWHYAQNLPTEPWRGALSLPRRLGLRTLDGAIRLVQEPVAELARLRGPRRHLTDRSLPPGCTPLDAHGIAGATLELLATFDPGQAREVGLLVRVGEDEETRIGYDVAAAEVFVDRRRSGQDDFHPGFAARHAGPLPLREGHLRLHVFVDWSSVEVFAGEGETVLTERIFPSPESTGVALYASGGPAHLVSLEVWPLASIWEEAGPEAPGSP
ncbi:MAG: hypothetical protein KatS3mg043_1666 [Rhodothermaceae bacterium]|nr:MAG: hypothetical protein KatS3mg043_1666 [Rhodothermaceae bacterium]